MSEGYLLVKSGDIINIIMAMPI